MSKLFNNTTSLNEILEAIQNKAAGSGGIDTSDATATTATILSGYTAYVKGEKITGTIETKTSSDLTSSGATVTIPAGYYASQATKSVPTGKATTPTTTITATPTISINSSGKITASVSRSKSITPTITAGYVSSGTAGTISVSGSNTKQLTTKGATTWTPKTTNQTIAASTYLTGVQTIKGDSNLVASNIKSGVSIFGVTGTYEGSISEDLTSEVSEYTNKIASLESAVASLETELANKASGGSSGGGTESTETCTLNITTDYQWYCGISYQGIDGWHVNGGSSKNYNISAICGSTVMVYQSGFYKAEISAGTILAEESSTGFVYQVPNTPNEIITINIITD